MMQEKKVVADNIEPFNSASAGLSNIVGSNSYSPKTGRVSITITLTTKQISRDDMKPALDLASAMLRDQYNTAVEWREEFLKSRPIESGDLQYEAQFDNPDAEPITVGEKMGKDVKGQLKARGRKKKDMPEAADTDVDGEPNLGFSLGGAKQMTDDEIYAPITDYERNGEGLEI